MKNYLPGLLFLTILGIVACKHQLEEAEKEVVPKTTASVCNITVESMSLIVEYPASTAFLKKSTIKSPVTGYIDDVFCKTGDEISKGKLMFTIRTKESNALLRTKTDTGIQFNGSVKVFAPISGIVASLTRQSGDYITENDELTNLASPSSLIFLANIPTENINSIKPGQNCQILLPDSRKLQAKVSSQLSAVDQETQTQRFIVTPLSSVSLPENMNCRLLIENSIKQKATVLPKAALLCNETQNIFWVMMLINDSTAIKVQVKPGIIQNEKAEILEPIFSGTDRILASGNYGLEDTVRVNIIKRP